MTFTTICLTNKGGTMKKLYLVWNLTNYDDGYEFLGAYKSKANAKKAYNKEMKARYGTTNEDKLWDLWDNADTACCDSWRIEEITIND